MKSVTCHRGWPSILMILAIIALCVCAPTICLATGGTQKITSPLNINMVGNLGNGGQYDWWQPLAPKALAQLQTCVTNKQPFVMQIWDFGQGDTVDFGCDPNYDYGSCWLVVYTYGNVYILSPDWISDTTNPTVGFPGGDGVAISNSWDNTGFYEWSCQGGVPVGDTPCWGETSSNDDTPWGTTCGVVQYDTLAVMANPS